MVEPPLAEVEPVRQEEPEEEEEKKKRDLKVEALSREHLMTHLPKNPWCPACQRAKLQRAPCARQPPSGEPKAFGDVVTADHIVSHSPVSMGIQGERDALVVKDRGTGWLSCYPVKDKSGDLARQALQHFRGSRNNVRLVYTDG
ncbi:MAG: hypothetical protein GY772_16170, partial [bacterium]|nr:hypothetical protein [bacterium]